MPPSKPVESLEVVDVKSEPLARKIAILKAAPWLPVEGEMRTATLVTVRRQNDDYGGHIVLVMEDDEYGIWAYHVFSALEMENLSTLKPLPGTILTVYNGGKRETNKSRTTWEAYRREIKALIDAGKNKEAEDVPVPERRFYHDNLILAGDGSDIDETEFQWDD